MMGSRFARDMRLGVKNLLLHTTRSILTMLGVVFGVGSVVAMLAVGEGASVETLAQIRRLGSNNILINSIKPVEDEQAASRRSFMSVYGLLYEDERRIRTTLPAVTATVPARVFRKEGRLGEYSLELRVVGTTPTWFELVKRSLIAGRALCERDLSENASVCVLTETGARRLFATQSTIGESIRIGASYFQVVGIIRNDSGGGAIETPDRDVDAYLPINVCRERFGEMVTRRSSGSTDRELVELQQIIIEVSDTDRVESTALAVEAMLKRFHKKLDYQIHVPLALLRQTQAAKRTFSIVLGSIAGISLLVGGIGIMNIMLASVTERTREIGVRRAIGARRRQIISQFLIETVVLSLFGGIAGVGVGFGIPLLIEHFAKLPTVVTLSSVVLALGISALVGIVFGVYPALRAAHLDPIVALRHE
ncbi:MAG: ABC transporter permease [Planctomycetota bacterium]